MPLHLVLDEEDEPEKVTINDYRQELIDQYGKVLITGS